MMAQESGKKVYVDKDSIFTRLSDLCRSPISFYSFGGTSATTSSPKTINSTHGEELNEGVYLFHKPQEQVNVEVVFIHGLEFDGSKEAYWKTWLAQDGTEDNCWPKTWLAKKFPNARILSLSYDAHVEQTSTSGRMDLHNLGESLVQQMTFKDIGQHDCPVVFVCHSFGGLVAKQIVVTGFENFRGDKKVQNLLSNLRAFHFYATPHGGLQVDALPLNPSTSKGSCMRSLDGSCLDLGRLNDKFQKICGDLYNNEWIFYNVGETNPTSHGLLVPEASARQVGHRYLPVSASHFDICRPQSTKDSSYQSLTHLISEVIKVHEDKQHLLLDLPKKLVGMDDMQTMIYEKLRLVSIIGLVGMGGIGKTTLSKFVFNSQAKFYDRTCFLQDVRSKGLVFVQKEMFEGLFGKEVGGRNYVTNDKLKSIRECIKERRVLLVIDDVGDSKTLEGLQVPTFQSNPSSGSRVIVTCCNRQVLEGLKDVEMVDVNLLDDARALELFRYHAFHGIRDDKMEDFQRLVVDIAKACCGLPLSLEVIGQHLQKQHMHDIRERKEIWEEALKKLREARSFGGGDDNEVLWKRLQISYDDLNNETKSMFLDFACIFCEKPSRGALIGQSIRWIWNSPTGLKNLVARSLIKVGVIDENGRSFTIHDQLRDMGRRIANESPSRRLHVSMKDMIWLWKLDDIETFLEDDEGSSTIEGISLRECSELRARESQVDPRLKQEMTSQRFNKLRLLNLERCGMEVVDFWLRKCGKKLSWLCLDKVDDLVMLQATEAIGFCTSLRVLQIRYCLGLEELPRSIGQLVHLLELDLSNCQRLRSLPHEIGYLKQLKRLQLRNCGKLKEVPSCVSQLTNLEYLGLAGCSSLVSMVEFETPMDHLYELNLCGCQRLQIPFKSLGQLHNLQTLNMLLCGELVIENPSESFGQLSQLEKLDLFGCRNFIPGLRLPYSIRQHGVEKVERLWDPVIKSFSSHLESLMIPAIYGVGFPMFPNLKVLNISNGFHLEELPTSLGDLTQLESLTMIGDYHGCLKKLPTSLSRLVKLKRLTLSYMKELDGLPDIIGELCSLEHLELTHWTKIEELPMSLGQLSKLEHLKLYHCDNLRCLPTSFTSLTRLSELELIECNALQVMDASQKLILQELEQQGCKIISHF